jgi:hypothetical protein
MTLSSTISALLIKKHGNNPNYAAFVKQFVKDVCEPLKDVDVRLASSGLGTLANIKQQEQRDAAGGKKKKTGKPLLGANKTVGRADTGTYDEILDDSGDYDDFVSFHIPLSSIHTDETEHVDVERRSYSITEHYYSNTRAILHHPLSTLLLRFSSSSLAPISSPSSSPVLPPP